MSAGDHQDAIAVACAAVVAARTVAREAEQRLRELLSVGDEIQAASPAAMPAAAAKRAPRVGRGKPNIRPSDPAKPDAPVTIRDRVLDVMREHGGVISGAELAQRTGAGLGSVLATASKLGAAGVVVRVSPGQFRLASAQP